MTVAEVIKALKQFPGQHELEIVSEKGGVSKPIEFVPELNGNKVLITVKELPGESDPRIEKLLENIKTGLTQTENNREKLMAQIHVETGVKATLEHILSILKKEKEEKSKTQPE